MEQGKKKRSLRSRGMTKRRGHLALDLLPVVEDLFLRGRASTDESPMAQKLGSS